MHLFQWTSGWYVLSGTKDGCYSRVVVARACFLVTCCGVCCRVQELLDHYRVKVVDFEEALVVKRELVAGEGWCAYSLIQL